MTYYNDKDASRDAEFREQRLMREMIPHCEDVYPPTPLHMRKVATGKDVHGTERLGAMGPEAGYGLGRTRATYADAHGHKGGIERVTGKGRGKFGNRL